MIKINKRVEVITDISSLKMIDSDRHEGYVTVQFNVGDLIPFYFDGEKLFIEAPKKGELEKFMAKKEKEEAKLNRPKTQEENNQDMKELKNLPTEMEEIKVVYQKDPTSPIVDIISYINNIIQG